MRRHQFDPISFVFGVMFTVVALALLSGRVDLGDLHLRWLWPVPLIVVGLALLASTRQRGAQPLSGVPAPGSQAFPEPERDLDPDPGDATAEVPAGED